MPHGGRHTFWVDTTLDLQVTSGSVTAAGLLTNISSVESRTGMTLIRLILCLDVAHLIHDSGEGIQNVAVGIGIASQEAFAANVFADPNTDTDFPMGGWLFRCRMRTYGFAADQAAVYNRVIERDLRAKRKLNNGNMFLSGANDAESGTASTIVIAGIVRALFLST